MEDENQHGGRKTTVYSVFGQIEMVISKLMAAEGKGRIIPLAEIPESAKYNKQGRLAYWAYLCPAQHQEEFENRILDLRA